MNARTFLKSIGGLAFLWASLGCGARPSLSPLPPAKTGTDFVVGERSLLSWCCLVVVGEEVEDFGWIVGREESQGRIGKILRLFRTAKQRRTSFSVEMKFGGGDWGLDNVAIWADHPFFAEDC